MLTFLDINYVEQFTTKLKTEFSKIKNQKKQITLEIENYFSPEYHLFDTPFTSNFTLPNVNYMGLNAIINSNLSAIIEKKFNPDVEIARPSFNKKLNRVNPEYNKFFSDLSSNNLSLFCFPIEALFITLSKMQWNAKLKTAKIRKIAQTCMIISKMGNSSFFEKEEDTLRVLKDQKIKNLENISKIYLELFQDFNKAND